MTVASVVLTAVMVAEATGGRVLSPHAGSPFTSVSIDSRTVVPGSLFIALRGDRFDGHDFVVNAVERGASALVVSREVTAPPGACVIRVSDTLVALQRLAHAVRVASSARVVAITGSVGKTTTKEITADLLSTTHHVYRTRGNLNNHIGLPLSLLDLRDGADIAVLELGMNHAGEIRTLVEIATPDVRVWTNVGDAHIGHFGFRTAVAAAKAEILEGASPRSLLVANADDPLVMAHARHFVGRTRTFGESAGADIRATSVADRGFDGTSAIVYTPGGVLSLTIPLPGRALVSNVLAAIAVAIEFDVPLTAIQSRVMTLQPAPRRGRSVVTPAGVRVIDDSYNASPTAVIAMIEALTATNVTGRRVAVIGEMLELGEGSRALHETCGRAAAAANLDALIVVGGSDAEGLRDGALAAGMPAERVLRFAASVDAAPAVAQFVRPGDLVLVKGSRGTRTDLIVDRLQEGD